VLSAKLHLQYVKLNSIKLSINREESQQPSFKKAKSLMVFVFLSMFCIVFVILTPQWLLLYFISTRELLSSNQQKRTFVFFLSFFSSQKSPRS